MKELFERPEVSKDSKRRSVINMLRQLTKKTIRTIIKDKRKQKESQDEKLQLQFPESSEQE